MTFPSVGGIILAAGRGTRMNSHTVNKVILPVNGKPLVIYGVELLKKVASPLVVVVGAFGHSVQDVLSHHEVVFAHQKEQKGTGDAVRIGFESFPSPLPDNIIVGYGDHMLFYSPSTVSQLLQEHLKQAAAITLVSAHHERPNELRYGRIVRNEDNKIVSIVEQKDATEKECLITEVNAGLYCFSSLFLKETLPQIEPSKVTGEYYLTDLIHIAIKTGKKVHACVVPFSEIGVGINSKDDLLLAEEIKRSKK